MNKEQREALSQAIHDAYAQWHVDRYKIDFTTWEEAGDLERQMYRKMAEAAFKAVKTMEEKHEPELTPDL